MAQAAQAQVAVAIGEQATEQQQSAASMAANDRRQLTWAQVTPSKLM